MSVLRNPVLMLTCALPLAAVIASFVTLMIAVEHGDSSLPEQYHSEGLQVDQDFKRAKHAAERQVTALIEHLGTGDACTVELRAQGALPDSLRVSLTHGSEPARDQRIVFQRVASLHPSQADTATYLARCNAIPAGRWRLELADPMNTWSIRRDLSGPLDVVALSAANTRSVAP